MKTKQELLLENSLLKERLSKAVVFEITEDISIGISEFDGLFRIRREEADGTVSFLNKENMWEEQAKHVDHAYSERTGYYTADEAFQTIEYINNYGVFDLLYDPIVPNSTIKILKNN